MASRYREESLALAQTQQRAGYSSSMTAGEHDRNAEP